MNRWLQPPLQRFCLMGIGLVIAATGFLVPTSASAQAIGPQRIPPMSTKAISGVMVVTLPPVVMLDGKPERLSPGARIRAQNNLVVLSASLVGRSLPVRYVRDPLGLLQEVWILTDAEALAFPPVPAALAATTP